MRRIIVIPITILLGAAVLPAAVPVRANAAMYDPGDTTWCASLASISPNACYPWPADMPSPVTTPWTPPDYSDSTPDYTEPSDPLPPEPTRGTAPAPTPKIYVTQDLAFHIKLAWEPHRDAFETYNPCKWASTPVTLTIGSTTWAIQDQCFGHWHRVASPSTKGVSWDSFSDSDQFADVGFSKPGRYAYRLTQNGQTVLAGWVQVKGKQVYKATPENATYYQGSDDFWNYCIVKDKPIRSSGGKLYCNGPTYIDHYSYFAGSIKLHPTVR